MLYGFIGFVLLCGSAVTGQVLALKTQVKPLTLDDLRAELKNINVPDAQKQTALNSYSEATSYIQQRDFDRAVQALESSINQVPTLAAQYTLAVLYQQKGDAANAGKYIAAAQSTADRSGDSFAQLRVTQLAASRVAAQSESHGMIGDKRPLPEGGKSLEEAASISPGLYVSSVDLGYNVFRYYKIRLKAGQTLAIDFMTSDTGTYAAASIYDADGVLKVSDKLVGSRSTLKTIKWQAPSDASLYFSIGSEFPNSPNTFYRIAVL